MIEPSSDKSGPTRRRDFFKEACAGLIGAFLGLVPLGAGLTVFLDPLRRRSGSSGAVWITNLEALPNDSLPRKFPVLTTRVDAWNRTSQVPIGAVYLRRTGERKIEAFNVVCPHLGCFVDFQPDRGHYLCPCHNSTFSVNGKIEDRASPAPRGLDSLPVELRNDKEVWVQFQNFQTGRLEKIPTA
jgi:menaquinol-cytochrome c reductase iron-sulfur subunit